MRKSTGVEWKVKSYSVRKEFKNVCPGGTLGYNWLCQIPIGQVAIKKGHMSRKGTSKSGHGIC